MKKGGKKVRRKLFDQLSADLSRVLIGKRDVIMCPLCLREFGRESVEYSSEIAETDRLTEEHVIPGSTGNYEVTLTCKRCNNTLGDSIDSHLARKIRLDLGITGQVPVKAKLRWDDAGSPADFHVDSGGKLNLRIKPPTDFVSRSLMDLLKKHESGERRMKINLSLNVNRRLLLASLTKAAYLGLFVHRGYAYILRPTLDMIRRAILEDGPDRERLCDIVVFSEIGNYSDLPGVPDRLTFESESLGGVPACISMVNLKNASGVAFVILPPEISFTGAWNGLEKAAKAFKEHRQFNIEMDGGGKLTLKLEWI